jgi:hypothetical protein
MLKRAFWGLLVVGAFLLWRFGSNATMPTLEKEAQLAPSAEVTSLRFKPGSWACTSEEFKLQVLNRRYYAKPMVIRIEGNGPPEFCREINTSHDYTLLASTSADANSASPCPDHSCVAFSARVSVGGREDDWVLYAPNSFIASSR